MAESVDVFDGGAVVAGIFAAKYEPDVKTGHDANDNHGKGVAFTVNGVNCTVPSSVTGTAALRPSVDNRNDDSQQLIDSSDDQVYRKRTKKTCAKLLDDDPDHPGLIEVKHELDDSALLTEVCEDELSDGNGGGVVKNRRKRAKSTTKMHEDDEGSVEICGRRRSKRVKKLRNPKRQRLKVKASKNGLKQTKRSTGPGRFRCSSCDFETNSSRQMYAHTLDHKLEDKICYYCELRLDSLDLLEEHIVMRHADADTAKLPFTCHECSMKFRSHALLMSHIQRHSADRPYVCAICGASFKWRATLRNHGVIHTGEQHLCDVCGYSTTRRAQLRAHRLVHTGGTLRCTWPGCDFLTTKNYNLKCHVLTHTEQKPYLQCEICGQSFAWPRNLKRHMLDHSDAAVKHRCEYCDYSTLRYNKLKEHLYNKHKVGAAPGRRMRTIDLVKKHQSNSADPGQSKTAGSEPPAEAHQCVICGRSFATKRNLKRHMLGHSSDAEKQKCQYCDYSTLRYDKLKEHLYNKHKIVSAPRLRQRSMEIYKLNILNVTRVETTASTVHCIQNSGHTTESAAAVVM